MNSMRYQIFTPSQTTFGPCQSCSGIARGSAVCDTCLRDELANIVGSHIARQYHTSCLALREAELRVIEQAQ